MPEDFSEQQRYWMGEALREAALAETLGEVPAGAVLLDSEGRLIGRGRNQVIGLSDPTAHAEILALRAGAAELGNYRLSGAVLYSTLEPCAMCLMAAVHARLACVIFGAREPRWGAAGSLVNLAELPGLNHRLSISGGLMAEECGKLISDFFRNKRRPIKEGLDHGMH